MHKAISTRADRVSMNLRARTLLAITADHIVTAGLITTIDTAHGCCTMEYAEALAKAVQRNCDDWQRECEQIDAALAKHFTESSGV